MYTGDFTFLYPIESGGYSTVWKVKHNSKNRYYALKMISRDKYQTKRQKKNLKMEIKIHKQLEHENIIKLISYFEDKFFVYLVMELGDDDLFNYLNHNQLSDNQIIEIIYQLILAINYLHQKEIIHSDIKLENILLVKNKIKLCDFGLSTQNYFHYGAIGTVECMAPEIIKGDVYSNKIDVWSFGIVLYYLVYGKSPFLQRSDMITKRAICEKELDFPEETIFTDLIKKCLEKDASKRYSAKDLLNYKLFEKFSKNKI